MRITKGESTGGNYARNKGIIKASGVLLAFLDDIAIKALNGL